MELMNAGITIDNIDEMVAEAEMDVTEEDI